MKRLVLLSLCCAVPALALAGGADNHSHGHQKFSVGEPGSGEPHRRITVSMKDSMRFEFSPELGQLRHGEHVEFVVHNHGEIRHEFSIGNAEDQVRHAAMMRQMPGMEHADPNTVALDPGESARIGWRFLGNDTVVFACNIPGHFEAGMKHAVAIEN